MNNFLSISTVYPNFLKDFYNNQYDKNENYEVLLEKFFSKNYSISNNLTKELTKLDYNCIEIIENANLIQKQWLKQSRFERRCSNNFLQCTKRSTILHEIIRIARKYENLQLSALIKSLLVCISRMYK